MIRVRTRLRRLRQQSELTQEELSFRAYHFVYGLRALPVTW